MKDYRQIQKAQFEKISKNYEEVHGQVISGIYKVLQEHYYSRCSRKKILDLGNGGQPPSKVLSEEVAVTVRSFVGLDNSIEMLQREKTDYVQVVGDGLRLPFKDKVFDYVILNGVIHHLGFSSPKEHASRVKQLIEEALRVCAHQIIVYELVTSKWLEQGERFVAAILGHMTKFVLSEFTLEKYLHQIGVSRKEIISKRLSDLTYPFYWYAICMNYEWFKLPAFLSPYKHVFFVLPQ